MAYPLKRGRKECRNPRTWSKGGLKHNENSFKIAIKAFYNSAKTKIKSANDCKASVTIIVVLKEILT